MSLIVSISGIRGTIGGMQGSSLTPLDIVQFASSYGQWIRQKNGKKVVIGRDARPSGDMVNKIVTQTLLAMGLDVIDLGISTTPTVEMAVIFEEAAGGIIISASHNPIQWNALKLLNGNGEFMTAAEGNDLLEIKSKNDFYFAEIQHLGTYSTSDSYIDFHIRKILELPLVDVGAIEQAEFKVAVDAINSSGAIAIPKLLKKLGVKKVHLINGEPHGHFAHNPEPLPENVTELAQFMQDSDFDLGIVVDPDVDRLAFVCEDGTFFGEEYTLVSIADYVLKHTPGNTVSNLSSTQALKNITEKYGKIYQPSAVGEVNVTQKMREIQAVIGGEGNGGVIYPALHYGRDALVGIALFLSHLAQSGTSAAQIRNKLPNYFISKNKIELTPDLNIDDILIKISQQYKQWPQITIDGLRIDFENAWIHLRKSNTEPIIRIYAESDTQNKADHLAKKMIDDIKELL